MYKSSWIYLPVLLNVWEDAILYNIHIIVFDCLYTLFHLGKANLGKLGWIFCCSMFNRFSLVVNGYILTFYLTHNIIGRRPWLKYMSKIYHSTSVFSSFVFVLLNIQVWQNISNFDLLISDVFLYYLISFWKAKISYLLFLLHKGKYDFVHIFES